MERDLWGDAVVKHVHYLVFHDESEPKANRGWLLIGLLFVEQSREQAILQQLTRHRQQENYCGEIHFCDLPKSFRGEFGAKARVARRWLKAYQDGLHEQALFTCLAVNRASPRFEAHRFSQDYHAYNRFTAMAIKAGIAWLLGPYQYDAVRLQLVSDAKDRKSRPDQGMVDNFDTYVGERVEMESWMARLRQGKPYPDVTMEPIRLVASHEHDLLQLADLLLGAFQCALVGIANRPTKRELASYVIAWCADLRHLPWRQRYQMHRKFDVWGFPDDNGRPFNDFNLCSPGDENQMALF
jgi:hypothetical protein